MWLPISPLRQKKRLGFYQCPYSARTVPVQCPLVFSKGEPKNQNFKDSDSVHQTSFNRATLPIGKTQRALNGHCTGTGNFHTFRPQGLRAFGISTLFGPKGWYSRFCTMCGAVRSEGALETRQKHGQQCYMPPFVCTRLDLRPGTLLSCHPPRCGHPGPPPASGICGACPRLAFTRELF